MDSTANGIDSKFLPSQLSLWHASPGQTLVSASVVVFVSATTRSQFWNASSDSENANFQDDAVTCSSRKWHILATDCTEAEPWQSLGGHSRASSG